MSSRRQAAAAAEEDDEALSPSLQIEREGPLPGGSGSRNSTHKKNGNDEEEEEEEEEEDDDDDEEEEEAEGSSELTASEDETSWINWFVNLRGNDFFCEVDEEYIQDDFNLTGLVAMVPYYDYALDMILDVDIPMDSLTEEQQEVVETAAEVLYGLIHARFILTTRGMQKMYEKFQSAEFGRCQRVYCQGQAVLPLGLSDVPRNYSVNVFCPRCHEIFYPRSTKQANLDGAYFGTTFAHLFLLSYPEHIPPKPQQSYVPRIYGFRIHSTSAYFTQRDVSSSVTSSSSASSSSSSSSSLAVSNAPPPPPPLSNSTTKQKRGVISRPVD